MNCLHSSHIRDMVQVLFNHLGNIEVNTSTSSVSPTNIRSVVRNELHQLLVRFYQICLHPDKHHKGLVNIANRHRFPMLAMLVLLAVFNFVIRGAHRPQWHCPRISFHWVFKALYPPRPRSFMHLPLILQVITLLEIIFHKQCSYELPPLLSTTLEKIRRREYVPFESLLPPTTVVPSPQE